MVQMPKEKWFKALLVVVRRPRTVLGLLDEASALVDLRDSELVEVRARLADLESLVGCFYSDGFRAIENGRQVDPTFVMALALQSGLDFAPDGKPSVAEPRCHCCGLTLPDCVAGGCGAHEGRTD